MKLPNTFKRLLSLEASAGTGKTFALSVRYISLLILGARPNEILSLTFTNKAASEMEERIFDIIRNPEDKKDEIREISKSVNMTKKNVVKNIKKIAKDIHYFEFKIMTIDSFINSIIRSFGPHIGVRSDFKISDLSENEEAEVFIKHMKQKGIMQKLVKFSDTSGLSLKETIEKLIYIHSIEKEVSAVFAQKSIAASNYNLHEDIAAIENEVLRIRDLIVEELKNLNASNRAINTFSAGTVEDLLKKTIIEKDSLDYSVFAKVYTPELDSIFFELKRTVKRYFDLKEMKYVSELLDIYVEFKEATMSTKKRAGVMSFNDVSNKAFEIMNDQKFDFLKFKLDMQIKHFLIDEFQDTSWTQYQILLPIINEISSTDIDGESKTFFMVGDKKQSIYRFRGGNYKLFNKAIKDHNLYTQTLNINFRSAKEIVYASNRIFEKVYSDFVIQVPNKKNKGRVNIEKVENPKESAAEEVEKILNMRKSDNGNIAVLVFTNDEVLEMSNLIKEKIEGVEVSTDTSTMLVKQQLVKIIIEALRYQQTGEDIHKMNFFALQGKDPVAISKIDEDAFLTFFAENQKLLDNPMVYVYNLVNDLLANHFEIFNGDLNVLKFIEKAHSFNTVEELVDNVNTIKDSIVNTGTNSLIRVLTIHKAKGLEFENVIVIDKKQSGTQNIPMFFEYNENVNVSNVWKKSKNRDFVDNNYKNALEKEKSNGTMDTMNALYVALTRAQSRLSVFYIEEKSKMDPIKELLESERVGS